MSASHGPHRISRDPACSAATTFCHAVSQEPLARACVEALAVIAGDKYDTGFREDGRTISGSGLKVMRLVSKQVNAAMLRNVNRYTLTIDDNAVSDEVPGLGNIMQHVQLSSLRVKLLSGELCSK